MMKILLQTEYRQVNKNSNHIMQILVYLQKKKKIRKKNFFYEYDKILTDKTLIKLNLNLKLRKSFKRYLFKIR